MKYEYKEEIIDNENYLWKLNEQGLEGWQVVDVEDDGFKFGGYSAVKVLFMREIKELKQEKDSE